MGTRTTHLRGVLACVLLGAALFVPASAPASEPRALDSPRARLTDYFTKDDIERSRRYRNPAYLFSFLGLGTEIAVLLLIGLGRGTRGLGSFAERVGGDRWWLQAITIAAAITIIVAVADLPFSASREALDKSWGLSTRTKIGFLGDFGRNLAFQGVLTMLVALGFYWIVRVLPRAWPLAAGGGAVVLTVALSTLWPLIYEPLFNTFTPVEPELRERIVALGERSGVHVGSVVVADASRRTTRQNAYVSGLGSTKRVVLYDTLLERTPPDQVDLVVAHEIAHVAHRDVLKGTLLGSAAAASAVALIWLLLRSGAVTRHLGVTGTSDPRTAPFLALVIVLGGLLVMPLGNWYSRRIEAAADRTAVRVTQDPDTAIALEVSLARDNIADLQPNPVVRFGFFSHPPVLERIQIALDEGARVASGR